MINIDLKGLTGEVVTKDDFIYEESRKAWNRAIEKYPLVIVYCYENIDVINAIAWAKSNSLPIRIRSGSHHYEGYSTGNDLVVIDISRMNKIYIDEEKNKVKIQGGVRNREMYEATGQMGYPFPGGGCPTVGVSGLVLGGGWGYSGRLLGLACDSLMELEMVDYEGNIVVANEKCNEDLFWACRGAGGGNFGVIVSMTFNLPKKIEMATLITIDYPGIGVKENIDLIETWQNKFKTLDNRINLKMATYNSKEKGRGVKFTGVFYGTKEEANEVLKPFKNVATKMSYDLDYTTVLKVNRQIQDSHPDYESYKSTGRFVYKEYTRSEIEELINLVKNMPEGAVYVAISLYGLGGAIMDKIKDSTAFYYRDAKAIMGFQSVWEDSKYASLNKEWLVEKFQHIKSVTTGSFVNFPITELENYEEEYYGENILKLRKVKGKYDPKDVFNYPQGIKVE